MANFAANCYILDSLTSCKTPIWLILHIQNLFQIHTSPQNLKKNKNKIKNKK